jgi:hypothetical protein
MSADTKNLKTLNDEQGAFTSALAKIATAGAASSRASIEASRATKPSLHTRFSYDPAKGRGER